MNDVVGRAEAARGKLREVCAASDEMVQLRLALAIEELDAVVPELVAEIERLREVDEMLEAIHDVADSYRLIAATQILEILHPADEA